jgi:hypothetical protein
MPPGIGDFVKFSAEPDHGSRVKIMQVQRLVIQNPLRFRVSGQKDLKSPVKEKPFRPVRAHPSTHSVQCLNQEKANPFLMKSKRTAKARKSSSYDNHIAFRGHSILLSELVLL